MTSPRSSERRKEQLEKKKRRVFERKEKKGRCPPRMVSERNSVDKEREHGIEKEKKRRFQKKEGKDCDLLFQSSAQKAGGKKGRSNSAGLSITRKDEAGCLDKEEIVALGIRKRRGGDVSEVRPPLKDPLI